MGAYSEVSRCTAIDNTPGSICQLQHAPYRYIPTLWVGVLFSIIFAICFLGHMLLSIWPGRFQRGGFMLLAAVCAGGEMAGWAARTTSHYDFFSRNPYMVQLICLILAPIFISAANYVALERITLSVGTELSRLSSKVYFGIFVSGDILSLVVQAAGGGMSATADTNKGVKHGSDIALAGVIIQVFVTGPFLVLFCDFHYRHYRLWKQGLNHDRWTQGVVRFSCATFVSTIFILIRCIYRCAEMNEGWTGYLSTHEPWFCIFDGAMISVAVSIFLFVHPGFTLPIPWTVRGQFAPVDKKAMPTAQPYDNGFSTVPFDQFPANATSYVDGVDNYYNASSSSEKLSIKSSHQAKTPTSILQPPSYYGLPSPHERLAPDSYNIDMYDAPKRSSGKPTYGDERAAPRGTYGEDPYRSSSSPYGDDQAFYISKKAYGDVPSRSSRNKTTYGDAPERTSRKKTYRDTSEPSRDTYGSRTRGYDQDYYGSSYPNDRQYDTYDTYGDRPVHKTQKSSVRRGYGQRPRSYYDEFVYN